MPTSRFPDLRATAMTAWALLGLACSVLPPAATSARSAGVSVQGVAHLSPSAGAPRRLMAYVPYTATDVDHLEASIWRADQSEATLLDTQFNLDPATPIVITNLKQHTDYRVRLKAFDGSGARIDNQGPECVSEFSTGQVDATGTLTFGVRLADRVFPGVASGTIVVTGDASAVATATVALRHQGALLDQLEVSGGNLGTVIELSHLKRDREYEVLVTAVDAAGHPVDDCEAATPACLATFTMDPSGPMAPLSFGLRLP
ncbi:MAG: hypothetical protein VKP62_00150 [Candidatus Sericytochromatia bacterium]|nr:hypothetical protein [Candidatus Sericytochromatia bacterium]